MALELLENIRSRPYHERRTLALALFVASAAIVVALGVTSFAAGMQSPAFTANENIPTTSEEAASPKSESETLNSPFQTLKQAFQELINGIEETKNATHELATAIEKAGSIKTSTPLENGTSSSTVVVTPPPPVKTPAPVPVKPKKETLALIASSVYEITSHNEHLQTLIIPPLDLELRADDEHVDTTNKVHTNAFLQTIQNAYNALRE